MQIVNARAGACPVEVTLNHKSIRSGRGTPAPSIKKGCGTSSRLELFCVIRSVATPTSPVTLRERRPDASRLVGEGSAARAQSLLTGAPCHLASGWTLGEPAAIIHGAIRTPAGCGNRRRDHLRAARGRRGRARRMALSIPTNLRSHRDGDAADRDAVRRARPESRIANEPRLQTSLSTKYRTRDSRLRGCDVSIAIRSGSRSLSAAVESAITKRPLRYTEIFSLGDSDRIHRGGIFRRIPARRHDWRLRQPGSAALQALRSTPSRIWCGLPRASTSPATSPPQD